MAALVDAGPQSRGPAGPNLGAAADGLLATEKVSGDGIWVHPAFDQLKERVRRIQVKVWFDEQFLGDGKAYRRRAKEFDDRRRGELRVAVMKTLKALSDKSYVAAKDDLDKLVADEKISDLQRHWIINGFSCTITPEVMVRGQERYNIFCSPCHDRIGNGRGMIVLRGFKSPPTFHSDRLRNEPAGHFFDVMTNGFGAMYDYADRTSPHDRWAIAAYIRALQKSQNSTLEDVPEEEHKKLE